MNLDTDQLAALKKVEKTTARLHEADLARWEAIYTAERAGVPRLRIAKAAGIAVMTMWRRLEESK